MSFKINAISFILFAENITDAIIHPAILQNLNIIPAEWELAERPAVDELRTQLVFTNQVSLILQTDCIIFQENTEQQQLENLQTPAIVLAYLQTFHQLQYRSLCIVPQSELAFDSATAIASYLTNNLLASNFWQDFDDQNSTFISLQFVYPYKSGSFRLEIEYDALASAENLNWKVDFVGTFDYRLVGNNNNESITYFNSLISQWQVDVNRFTNHLQQYFSPD